MSEVAEIEHQLNLAGRPRFSMLATKIVMVVCLQKNTTPHFKTRRFLGSKQSYAHVHQTRHLSRLTVFPAEQLISKFLKKIAF